MAQIPARTTDLREVNLSRQLGGPQAQPQMAQARQAPPAVNPQVLTRQADSSVGPTGQTNPTLITDPNTLPSTITPENTLRSQRLGFGVEAGQVAAPEAVAGVTAERVSPQVQQAFAAQLPQLQQQFADEVEGLAKSTSALGRTGIGTFNKERGLIASRAQQGREALLGNLLFQATQGDAQRALAAQQGNQASDLSFRNLQANIAQSNTNRALDVDFARQAHLQNLQAREDVLGRQAVADEATRASLLQQGFAGAPTGAVGNAANVLTGGSAQFGENAALLGQQAGGLSQEVIQALLRGQQQVAG